MKQLVLAIIMLASISSSAFALTTKEQKQFPDVFWTWLNMDGNQQSKISQLIQRLNDNQKDALYLLMKTDVKAKLEVSRDLVVSQLAELE